MVYLVSYDLLRPNGEAAYAELTQALRRDGAVKILFSEWLVMSQQSAEDLGNRYLGHMDPTDRIFVCEVTQNSAWRSLMNAEQARGFFDRL